jgi:hypothetical protein
MKKLIAIATIVISMISSPLMAEQSNIDIETKIKNAKSEDEKVNILLSGGKKLVLTNYLLNRKIKIDSPNTLSPEKGAEFVPQTDEFIDIYFDFLDQGMKPMEAILMTHVSPEAMDIIKQYKSQKKLDKENTN